jgi:hypothetical protein
MAVIASWFINSSQNRKNFFLHHVYLLIQQDSETSFKPSLKPETGRIAVKVINHLGMRQCSWTRWPELRLRP